MEGCLSNAHMFQSWLVTPGQLEPSLTVPEMALSLQSVIRYSGACEAARRHQQTAVTEQMGAKGQTLHISCRTGPKSELVVVMVAWGGPWACCLQSYYTK